MPELLIIYSNLREANIVNRLRHVKALIAFARTSWTLDGMVIRR